MQWVLVMIVLDLMMVTMMLVTNMKIVNSFYEGIGVCCWLVIIARKQKIMYNLDSKAILVIGAQIAQTWRIAGSSLYFPTTLPCPASQFFSKVEENTPKMAL